jgi:hypothetical protein
VAAETAAAVRSARPATAAADLRRYGRPTAAEAFAAPIHRVPPTETEVSVAPTRHGLPMEIEASAAPTRYVRQTEIKASAAPMETDPLT